MNFFFCEKCNRRITEAELESGLAHDKKAKGVFCRQCSIGVKTSEFTAITNEQIKIAQVGPAETKRPSANSLAAVSRSPSSAERHSSIKMTPAQQRAKPAVPTPAKSTHTGVVIGAICGVTLLIFLLSGSNKLREHKPDSPPPPAIIPPAVVVTPAAPPREISPVEKTATTPDVKPLAVLERFSNKPPPAPPAIPANPEAKAPPPKEKEKLAVAPAEPDKNIPPVQVNKKSPATIYAEFEDDFLETLRSGDAQLAAQRLALAEQNPELKPLQKSLAQDRAVLKWMDDLDTALVRGIEKLRDADNVELRLQIGAPIHVGKRGTFQLASVSDGKFDVGTQGVSMTIAIDKLQASTRQKLTSMGLADDGAGLLRRAFMQVLTAGAEPALIVSVPAAIEKARKAGAADDEAAALEHFLTPSEKATREVAAAAAWDEINRQAADKQASKMTLLSAIEAFKSTFANTAFAAKKRDDIKTVENATLSELGMLLYLKFDDSAAIAADSSGRNSECKIVGSPVWTNGKFGGALSFDGAHDYIALPDGLFHANKTFTVSLWFNTRASGMVILGYQNGEPLAPLTQNFVPILFIDTGGKLHGKFWDERADPIAAPKAVNDGAWHHAALAMKEASQSLYLDGVCIGTLEGPHKPLNMIKNQLGLGFCKTWHVSDKDWSFYSGLLDDFRVFNRALSEQEIQAINSAPSKSP